MAYSEYQRAGKEYSVAYDSFYQAIESYDIKTLVHEAASQGVLADTERSEIQRQSSRHSMRDCLINSILRRGTREQQQFARFIHEFSRRAYEQTRKQLAGLNHHQESSGGCVHAGHGHGKEPPRLSQDSSHSGSADSTSPMELESKSVGSNIQDLVQGLSDDLGYFSISGSESLSNDPAVYASVPDSSTSYTSPSFMENELKKLQKTQRARGHRLQRFVSNTKRQVPTTFNFPLATHGESSQNISTINVVNVFNVSNSRTRFNSCSESPGADMLEYAGPVATHTKSSVDRYSPIHDQSNDREPHAEKWESEWSQCLKEHHCRIIEYLDVNTLLPHLWEKGLITPNERDMLDSMQSTPRKQARYLLRILPGKGKLGFKRFLECLREEKYHLGHEDLIKCLDHSSCSQNL